MRSWSINIVENLASFVPHLTDKRTALRDRLPRQAGSGLAASWNVLTSMGSGTSPFAEGGTPNEDASGYARRSAVYKELGKKKSITDKMLAAGKSFMDQEAEQTNIAIREVVQDEEQLLITGDSGFNALEFDGLKTLITTNVTDDANNALGFRTLLLDEALTLLTKTYNVVPSAILCSWGMKAAINDSLTGDVRVNIDQTNQVSTGVDVGFWQSSAGKMPFVPATGIADDTSSFPGYTVSDIYLITETVGGEKNIYVEEQYSLGKQMLARTGAAISFMVTESVVLVVRARNLVKALNKKFYSLIFLLWIVLRI